MPAFGPIKRKDLTYACQRSPSGEAAGPRLSAVTVVSHERPDLPVEVYGQGVERRWRRLASGPDAVLSRPRDLRLDAARALRSAGFRWILASTGSQGNAPIGNALVQQAPQWGMEVAGNAGRYFLFHIK